MPIGARESRGKARGVMPPSKRMKMSPFRVSSADAAAATSTSMSPKLSDAPQSDLPPIECRGHLGGAFPDHRHSMGARPPSPQRRPLQRANLPGPAFEHHRHRIRFPARPAVEHEAVVAFDPQGTDVGVGGFFERLLR
jgi:hypothetical protein